MNPNDLPSSARSDAEAVSEERCDAMRVAPDLLAPLLSGTARQPRFEATPVGADPHVVVGELLALTEDTRMPLVRYAGQPAGQAVTARTTIDLHGRHIGQPVLLVFENGDPKLPIVTGVIRGKLGWPTEPAPEQVEVDVDGQRMIVSAREQLVLRCGKASITLTKAGKVLIEGSYLLSRSSGVNKIKGGSVQLN
jgi:hypothetical protein